MPVTLPLRTDKGCIKTVPGRLKVGDSFNSICQRVCPTLYFSATLLTSIVDSRHLDGVAASATNGGQLVTTFSGDDE